VNFNNWWKRQTLKVARTPFSAVLVSWLLITAMAFAVSVMLGVVYVLIKGNVPEPNFTHLIFLYLGIGMTWGIILGLVFKQHVNRHVSIAPWNSRIVLYELTPEGDVAQFGSTIWTSPEAKQSRIFSFEAIPVIGNKFFEIEVPLKILGTSLRVDVIHLVKDASPPENVTWRTFSIAEIHDLVPPSHYQTRFLDRHFIEQFQTAAENNPGIIEAVYDYQRSGITKRELVRSIQQALYDIPYDPQFSNIDWWKVGEVALN